MANIGANGFDATQIDPSNDFEHVPADRYKAEITDSDMRDNAKGTGEYLRLEFTILDGPYAGRKLWTQLNLVNPSTQAVEIAQRELSAICHSVGKLRVQDSIQLHNIPLEINVKVKTSPEYGPQNIIRGYSAISGNGHRPTDNNPKKLFAPDTPEPSTKSDKTTVTPPWKIKQ